MECRLKDRIEKQIKMTVVAKATQVVRGSQCLSGEALPHERTEVDPRIETDLATGHGIDLVIDHAIDLEIGIGGE